MKVVAIVQARMGSTRLPGKVMKKVHDRPLIELLLKRLSKAVTLDQIIVATSDHDNNTPLANFVEGLGYVCEKGSEQDVLKRFSQASIKHGADVIVRITGDCPLVDPNIVDDCVKQFTEGRFDYLSNTNPPTFPDGLDVEVFSIAALTKADEESTSKFEREHVTPFIKNYPDFNKHGVVNNDDESRHRWTVDDPEDFEVISNVFAYFLPRIDFRWEEVLELSRNKPELFEINKHISRDQGVHMGTGQKLWSRAKKVIPGGNMLLSKRPEMFLPNSWPAYYSKASGCQVWDLDDKKYLDMSIMGIGTNILGYAHPEVDQAVLSTVSKGNMSTLNCPEEVELAERLVDMHPWADMARFARTGGEANAIAIRIARAASGNDKVAVCGYHGWHDWYLSANLGDDDSLDGHLLPGLDPKGVPRSLKGTIFPFEYNNFEQLERIVNDHDIGIIKMEVSRNEGPKEGYLEAVRDLASKRGLILIFDECTSGFRETFGGLHKKYGVEPDMAMFGKALGNGYAITAVLGKLEIMEAAQSTFISSTFWTERIGPTAALKTLEVMERQKSWETITYTGYSIRDLWTELATIYGLNISLWGLPALSGFTVESENSLAYKTLITQEMLKRGILASNSVYVSTCHDESVIDDYKKQLDPIFSLIADCEHGDLEVSQLLDGELAHTGFKRLN